MGSVVDSLKRLYKKIGGGKVKGPIAIDDLVDKIADQMSSSSGSSSGSNVGSNIMVLNVVNWDGDVPITNYTFSQLHDCLENGGYVVFIDYAKNVYQVDYYTNTTINFVRTKAVDDSGEGIYATWTQSAYYTSDNELQLLEDVWVSGGN